MHFWRREEDNRLCGAELSEPHCSYHEPLARTITSATEGLTLDCVVLGLAGSQCQCAHGIWWKLQVGAASVSLNAGHVSQTFIAKTLSCSPRPSR